MALEDQTVRPLPSTEPATTRETSRGLADNSLIAPAARQIHAAYDELAEHYVDATSAREWLTDLVGTIGEARAQQELAPFRDHTRTALPATTQPTETEHATIHRLLTVALAVLNGRRPRMRDIKDNHIATAAAQVSINSAAQQVTTARLKTIVTIHKAEPEARRGTDRTTFYIPSVITWGERYRPLAAVIDTDRNGAYRLTGFNVL